MTNLFLLLLAAQLQPGQGAAERVDGRDRIQGPMPVTDKFLIPPKIPDCRTQAQADAAVQAKRVGEYEKCDPERFIRAKGR